MRSLVICLSLLACTVYGQNVGTQSQPSHLPLSLQVCSAPGSCSSESNNVVLDSNWRWTHATDSTTNCYSGNVWDASLCPDPDTCTTKCAIEPTPTADWTSPYGVTTVTNGIAAKFVTKGQYSTNVGTRMYMLDSSKTKYRMFQLLNKEFTFDVDVSTLECGLNGALYFVDMDADGGLSKYPTNKGGAALGTGYCDAQCPHDVKWINGKANNKDWKPSTNDANSGTGFYGTCCAELDIWEANKYSQAFTTHPCDPAGQTQCEGVTCGDNASGDRYKGQCDKDGCDFASYRMGNKTFYGAGTSFTVNTLQPITVVTQFITTDGTDNGDLKEMRRFYVQNGVKIANSKSNHAGLPTYDSITDQMCDDTKALFEDINHHKQKGGLRKMGEAMKRGMVLVLSLWDDHDANMLWLDSNYPADGNPSKPGVARGPCPTISGNPTDVESQYPDATVKFSNIKVGAIGSTTGL